MYKLVVLILALVAAAYADSVVKTGVVPAVPGAVPYVASVPAAYGSHYYPYQYQQYAPYQASYYQGYPNVYSPYAYNQIAPATYMPYAYGSQYVYTKPVVTPAQTYTVA